MPAAANQTPAAPFDREKLLDVIRRHWGFSSLRPLQEQAIQAVLAGRDSLLVLPTGGGKSLCYQAPAVYRGDTLVVISPLISLMKDQVDALRANGIAATQLNSAMSNEDIRQAERAVLDGAFRLIFASPERMVTTGFRNLLRRINVRSFAIDEAHCISHWGHDFRPEYRQLRQIKELFPQASVHAFTATATEQVRADIVEQLGVKNADVFVGNFDRPNLTYRVVPKFDLYSQVFEVLDRHKGEAGIIYCIRRKDVDELTPVLKSAGLRAIAYHAGLSTEERKAAHDAFSDEKVDVVVATVAFGMGIDRSNIRYVLHTGMPKSIEHYQQETGRAGRDGLEAECVLLHGGGDALTWKKILEKSVGEAETPVDPEYLESAYKHIDDMESYCRPVQCRHKTLVGYFGQTYEHDNCGACDMCLGDAEAHPESQTIAKKILSCVFRVSESFGTSHVAAVLRGANTEAIRQRGHDQVTTYGLLKEWSQSQLRDWIGQLVGQQVLLQVGNEYPVLKLNDASWDVMKDRRTVSLLHVPVPEKTKTGSSSSAKRSKAELASWDGVDRELFEAVRHLRFTIAEARGVPPYIIFSDASLRDMARLRPSSLEKMKLVYGVGEAKLREFGQTFFETIDRHCSEKALSRDNVPAAAVSQRPIADRAPRPQSAGAAQAAVLFRRGASIDEVAEQLERARGTVCEYLADYIRTANLDSISHWVPDELYRQIAAAAAKEGTERLRPIFVALDEQVPYDQIKLVVAHLASRRG